MDYRLTPEDKERVRLLMIVSKKGIKTLSLEQLEKLQKLVEEKDYTHSKKAQKSKKKAVKQDKHRHIRARGKVMHQLIQIFGRTAGNRAR